MVSLGHGVMRLTRMVMLWGVVAIAVAQGAQDPFGEDPFGAAPAAADPFSEAPDVADPFGVDRPPVTRDPVAREAPADPDRPGVPIGADEADPAVLAIGEMDLSTPENLMFAVRALFDMGRFEEAKFYQARLLDLEPAAEVWVQFYEQYGESLFHRLRIHAAMAPQGTVLARAVLDANHEAARVPERLQGLIREFSSPSPARRARAIDQLRLVGETAVPALLEALADPRRAGEHAAIRRGMSELGEYLVQPMLGALQTPDHALQVQVIGVLGGLGDRRAVTPLLVALVDPESSSEVQAAAEEALVQIVGGVPNRAQIAQFLERRARDFFAGMLPGRLDYEDRITLWSWDAEQGTTVPERWEAHHASLLHATRWARALFRMEPERHEHQRLYLVTSLEWAKYLGGLDQPLVWDEDSLAAEVAQLPLSAVEDALVYAMETGREVAAMAAVEVLGQRGDARLVDSAGGQARPLARALRHADRRVRLAAAEAILQIDPPGPYAGSSHLIETLDYAIRTQGTRRALVVHPRVETGRTLVGLLAEIGFEADAAATGRTAFRLASAYPDYEFVLISDAVDRPAVQETIQMFRRDPRTNRLAIGLMGRHGTLAEAERFAESDSLVLAFPRPLDRTGLAFQGGRLLRLAGRGLVDVDERMNHAVSALKHLERLVEHPRVYGFYDLHRLVPTLSNALATPELSVRAATILGHLGGPDSQRALVALASQEAMSLRLRQAAVVAFEQAVQQRGVLLTRAEILLQYERYNLSEHADVATQQVLGAILDAIESPTQAAQSQADPPETAPTAS